MLEVVHEASCSRRRRLVLPQTETQLVVRTEETRLPPGSRKAIPNVGQRADLLLEPFPQRRLDVRLVGVRSFAAAMSRRFR